MNAKKILYLHGFNSSPASHKAQLITQYMEQKGWSDRLLCPQIPVVPIEARDYLEHLVEDTMKQYTLNFIGSSLGGYYATYLAEKYNGKAVLINPSVRPFETLKAYLGTNTFYFEDGSWDFDESHIQQLRDMYVDKLSDAKQYLVLLQTGDETLDYREAEEKYKAANCIVERGGDHSFTNLERHLSMILKFSDISDE